MTEVPAPVFPDLAGEWESTESGTVLRFARAENAHSYEVRFSDGEVQTYFSSFYLGDEAEEREALVVYGKKAGVYDTEIRAVNALGEKSAECVRISAVNVVSRRYRRKFAPEIWY